MKKISVVFALTVLTGFACLFVACDSNVPQGGNSSLRLEEQMHEESILALEAIGSFDKVIGVPAGFSFPEAFDDNSRALKGDSVETAMIDGTAVSCISFMVEFNSFNESMESHFDSIPSVEIEFDRDVASGCQYDPEKTYLIIRNYYFEGTLTPAFREVCIIDGLSLVRGDVSTAKITSFSPDFRFDIKNQWDLVQGVSKRYNWISKQEGEADEYRLLDKTENEKFAKLASVVGASSVLNVWQRYHDGNPVTYAQNEGAYYIIELDPFNVKVLEKFELGSIGKLSIGSFFLENPNSSSVYVKVTKYPNHYRSCYSITLFWNVDGRWNYTIWIATDSDFSFKYYEEIPLDELKTVFPNIDNIGTPTVAYIECMNGEPLKILWQKEIDGYYVVEFSKVRDTLLSEAKNSQGRTIGSSRIFRQGLLKPDSVACLYIIRNKGKENYSVCIILEDGEGSQYSSYTYLSYDEDFNKVSDMCSTVDYKQLPDEALAEFHDFFPSAQKVWQKYKNEQPVKYNDDGGAHYIISMRDYRPSFNPDFLKTIQYRTGNRISIDGFEPESCNSVYVKLAQLPEGYRDKYKLLFYWYNFGDGGYWCWSNLLRADSSKRLMFYKELDSIPSELSGLSNIGTPSRIYQEYVEEKPIREYIVEFSSVKETFPDEVKTASGSEGKEIDNYSFTRAERVLNNTVATMDVISQEDGSFRSFVVVKNSYGNWFWSCCSLFFDKDFTTVTR